ncbi:unnamed protein product [Dovyalis caffra]|uniref:Serine aminopeptidase S33 domain-containing protein n=1 Tax=Dovyalis caffra TaxID=77055 RepID=A0AAV1RZ80_9ROSI|nr:unnamed protein product [Dovyalis caffra]
MESVVTFRISPYIALNSRIKPRFRVRLQSLGGDPDLEVLSSDSIAVSAASCSGDWEKNRAPIHGGTGEKEKGGAVIDGVNVRLKSRVERKRVKDVVSKDLEVLWDDGYGNKTVKDYLDGSNEMIKPDGGPPRWFCPVDCGQPLQDSPILLFLPGMDGVGLGLILHHKALGKVFEVQCLHIPVYDRTPFEGLVKFVEETVRLEHASSPNKPIYIVGDSFGGCLALAVAARNPKIDLVVILSNPATSFGRSHLQPILPILEGLPDGLHNALPYLLNLVIGNPLKMAIVDIEYRLPPRLQIEQVARNLIAFLHSFSTVAIIVPKDTLLWKLKLLKSAAAYANSRLHAVKAEVLLLVSGKDYVLPSRDEAQRLKSSLQNCTVRYFKDNGHIMLMEDGINLLTIIKGTSKYRRSRRVDFVSHFLPPSMSEVKRASDEVAGFEDLVPARKLGDWNLKLVSVNVFCSRSKFYSRRKSYLMDTKGLAWLRRSLLLTAGSAVFSTLDDGKIVKGLAGVPNEGPVLLIGYHMLMGNEIYSLVAEFLTQKKIRIRGVAHPDVFSGKFDDPSNEFSLHDWMKVMGAVPVTANNLFKLLSTKSHVLLYPGGTREALHLKGEEYKLFWPDQPEFVRMAARFGATIVPFGTVGEDDIQEQVLDYHDLMKIPIVNDYVRDTIRKATPVRDESKGEVASQEVFMPVVLPKIPGRFYFLFGKPIETKGMKEMLQEKGKANELYLQIKSEVERSIAYLLEKRKEDPYRNIIDRTIYRALHSPSREGAEIQSYFLQEMRPPQQQRPETLQRIIAPFLMWAMAVANLATSGHNHNASVASQRP